MAIFLPEDWYERGRWLAGWRDGPTAPPPPLPPPRARGAAAAARPLAGQQEEARRRRGLDPRTVWDRRHEDRIAVLRRLRVAGLLARREWDVSSHDGVYTSGPAAGLRVVDPWGPLYRRIRDCCRRWGLQPTEGGSGELNAYQCDSARLCAICAARDAGRRGAELATLCDGRPAPWREGRPGAALLVTLTQRDRPPGAETCRSALDRLEAALDRVRRYPDSARWLASTSEGACWTIEVTGGSTGLSWHPHAHGIVVLRPGVSAAEWRLELAARWARASDLADPGWGWDPVSSPDGRWCREIEGGDRTAIHQATKYPVTVASLGKGPLRWAEWAAVARGRRLVRWWGWGEPERRWAAGQATEDRRAARAAREAAGGAPPGGIARGPLRPERDAVAAAITNERVYLGGADAVSWRHVATRDRAWLLCEDARRLRAHAPGSAEGWRIHGDDPVSGLRRAAAALAVEWRRVGGGLAVRSGDLAVALAQLPE